MNIIIPQSAYPILFEKVFGLPLIKHSLLHYARMRNCKKLTLHTPWPLEHTVAHFIAADDDLKGLAINISTEKAPANQFLINDLFTPAGEMFRVSSQGELAYFRMLYQAGLRLTALTPIARLVNKRLSIPFSVLLATYHVTPNAISFVALFLSLLGGLCLLNPHLFFVGFLFFQLNSLLDGCDGEVAKMNFTFSDFGKKLDVYSDYLTSVIIICCEAYGFYTLTHASWAFGLSVLNITCLTLMGFMWLLAFFLKITPSNFENVEGLCHKRLSCDSPSLIDRLVYPFLLISHRDFYILALFIFAVFGMGNTLHVFLSLVCLSWLILSVYMFGVLWQKHPSLEKRG
jgi:phosphatidylglycerophosphate synthase